MFLWAQGQELVLIMPQQCGWQDREPFVAESHAGMALCSGTYIYDLGTLDLGATSGGTALLTQTCWPQGTKYSASGCTAGPCSNIKASDDFTEASSRRTRDKSFKPKEGRNRLDVRHWNRFLRGAVNAPSLEVIKGRLDGVWPTWSTGRCPFPWWGVGIRWSLRSFLAQTILLLYDLLLPKGKDKSFLCKLEVCSQIVLICG